MKITLLELQDAISSSKSMREAASKLPINFKTFRTYAKSHSLYITNPGGKGLSKPKKKTDLSEILLGKHPEYHTYKLKNRLISERGWNHQCNSCGLQEWLGKPIPLELDHIDGSPYNHHENNLRLLCPNCHAQTPTYRNKKR